MSVLTTTSPPFRLARVGQVLTFDGPSAAIIRREVGRMIQSRMFRTLVIGLSGVNLMIAYVLLEGPVRTNEMEESVRTTLYAQAMILYAAGFAFTAARAGTCIGTERARNTWEMMWLTPASSFAIAFGHVVSALAPAMLLTVSQFPILAPMVYAVGPDEWPRLATAAAIGVTSWIACALWAFWASAQFKDFGRALAGAFLAAVWACGLASFMVVGTLVLFSSWSSPNWNPSFYSAEVLRISSPIMELYYLITYGVRRISLAPHLAFMLATALIPLWFGTRAIEREQKISTEPIGHPRQVWRRRDSGTTLTKMLAIPDWMNPVFAIERHVAVAGRTRLGTWLFAMISAFAVYLNYRTLDHPLIVESAGGIALLLVVTLGTTAWASANGSVISDERETFDMVAMTKLRAHEILRGKVLAALVSVVPVVILLAMCMTVAAIAGSAWILGFVCFLTFLLCITTLLSTGLFASVLARGLRESVITNVLLGVCVLFGVPILCRTVIGLMQDAVILNWFGIRRWFAPLPATTTETYQAFTDATSPITGLIQLLRNPEDSEAWRMWCIGAAMAVCWTVLWYNGASWMLRRKLAGKPVWSLELHPKE